MACRAELRVGDQLGFVTDHVLGQLVDLVGNFTNTIDTLFLGFPEVVRELFDNLEFKITDYILFLITKQTYFCEFFSWNRYKRNRRDWTGNGNRFILAISKNRKKTRQIPWDISIYLVISGGQPRGRIDFGLEEQSQSFFHVDWPFGFSLGNLGLADLALDNLNDDGFLKDSLDVGADLKMRWNIVLGRSTLKIKAMGG